MVKTVIDRRSLIFFISIYTTALIATTNADMEQTVKFASRLLLTLMALLLGLFLPSYTKILGS
jgi:hypothetical protein